MPRAFRKFCLVACATGAVLSFAHAAAPPVAPAAGSDAEAWVKFGIENGTKGELDTAISNFDEALKINPNFAPAYQCRGHALALQNKPDDAIADYNKAIEIDPKYSDAYYDRGVIWGEKGDFDKAIADFSKTIELSPKYASAYYNRGHTKYFLGDLDGAITDLNQAITLAPDSSLSYFIRGLARLPKEDIEGAAADFQQSAVNGYPDAVFWLWIVKMKSGEHVIAQSQLSDFLHKPQLFKPDDWPAQIGNFLLGKITQDQLMAKAKEGATDKDRLCDAWFYSGMAKRFSGDNKGALDCFQHVLAAGMKASELYVEAQRETASLQKL